MPLAPGEQWGQRWEFNTLVEDRDIDFARATLPNVGGVTEMLKIMAMCDTHKVGIVPHFTGPVGTAGHIHMMTAFPGQVVMEYNYGTTMPAYITEFVEFREGKCWPNDRPGLGISLEHGAAHAGGGTHDVSERQHLPAARRFAVALVGLATWSRSGSR